MKEESESDLKETIQTEAVDTLFETAESEEDDKISQSFSQYEDEDETESFKQAYLQTSQKRTNTLDNPYRVRIEIDVLKMGNSVIHFRKCYIKVENISYPKTAGLLQLLFQKQPDSKQISSNDIQSYQKIVEVTRAFRKKYNEFEPLRKSNSKNYKDYIAPFFNKSTNRKSIEGSGLIPKYKIARKGVQVDYVFWDAPNELVKRLRLLLAELEAGNQSHMHEIHSVIEELKEAGYIHVIKKSTLRM